jgi:hypothetical protein
MGPRKGTSANGARPRTSFLSAWNLTSQASFADVQVSSWYRLTRCIEISHADIAGRLCTEETVSTR